LRLREGEEQLVETNERMNTWALECPILPTVHMACPVRLFADLIRVDPKPFYASEFGVLRIPHHVHRPTHEELKRIHHLLFRGQCIEHLADAQSDASDSLGPTAWQRGPNT
jgi:hypothetical protein